MSDNQIVINSLSKIYDNGFNALKNIDLNIKKNNIQYLDEPYTRFKGKKEQQETFFIKDPHGNILELKTLNNS